MTAEEKEAFGRPDIQVLEPGTYNLLIERVEQFTNRQGTGKVLSFVFVTQGRHAKTYINYPHRDEKPDWHGRRNLRELIDALGIEGFAHHRDLEGKIVGARVSILQGERPKNGFEFIPASAQEKKPAHQESYVATPPQPPPAQPDQPAFWG